MRNLHPGGDEGLQLPHKDVCGCAVRQGNHCEEPVWVDVLEVFPGGCNQPARECVCVDVVDRAQFRVVKVVRVPRLWWSWGVGGGMVSRFWSGVVPVGRGALGWCQGVPHARSPWRALISGAANRRQRWAMSHRISEGPRSLSFLRPLPGRPRRAPVVAARPPRPGSLVA